MKPSYMLIGLVSAVTLALSSPSFADQVRGVVTKIDIPGDMFVIETEGDEDEGLTFTVGDDVEFADFIGDIEVGDEVTVEFDPDECGDDADCIDEAVSIDSL